MFGSNLLGSFRQNIFRYTKLDAEKIGFSDQFIYNELQKPIDQRNIPTIQILRDKALEAFKMWQEKEDKIEY